MDAKRILQVWLTLLIAMAGGALAAAIGLPAAWIIGSTLLVTAAALGGLPVRVPGAIRDIAFALIGLSMGSRSSSETLAFAVQWPLSFVGLILAIALSMGLTMLYLERLHRYDRATALLATSPGAITVAAALVASGHGNAAQAIVIQSIRLLALTAAVPLIIGLAGSQPAAGSRIPIATGSALLLLIVLAVATGAAMQRLRMPAAYLLGGMLAGLATHVTDLIPGALPDWMLIPGFVVTGAVIGSRFQAISLRAVTAVAGAASAVVLMSTAVTAAIAFAVAELLGLPFGQVWIAYAPGGVEVMAAMALTFDFDATYVAAHHILRYVLLGFGLSWLLPRVAGESRAE